MTKAEASLWKYVLSGKNLKGYQFRRQRPAFKYVADFLCKELMLIIEVDGITHDSEKAAAKDKQRERELTEAGFRILRFTDDEVLRNIDGVMKKLENMVDDIKTSTPGAKRHPRQRGTIKG